MVFLYSVAALLALCFVWGLFWPRSQWKMLASWSRRDAVASEPGSIAYGFHRLLSGLGVLIFLVVGFVVFGQWVQARPEAAAPLTAMQTMWGTAPSPQIVDRVVRSEASPNPALTPASILGYQAVDNVNHTPYYLAFVDVYPGPGGSLEGLIGKAPGLGFAALDSAELVVNLRGKSQCIPRQAVIIEGDESVQIGIYFGLPLKKDGSSWRNDFCAGGSLMGPSLLLPIDLAQPLGDRELQNLDGTPIASIPVVTEH